MKIGKSDPTSRPVHRAIYRDSDPARGSRSAPVLDADPCQSFYFNRDLECRAGSRALSRFRVDVAYLGGRRRLAAFLVTVLTLLVVIGPATWLALGLIDSLRVISERLDFSSLAIPAPSQSVKDWPLIGDPIYQFWDLASTNFTGCSGQDIASTQTAGQQPAAHRRRHGHRHYQVSCFHCCRRLPLFAGAGTRGCRQEFLRASSIRNAGKSLSSKPPQPSGRYRAALSAFQFCRLFLPASV